MAEAPNQAIARRRTYLFAGGVTLLFLAAGGYGAFHHEMWRDETQAWLLARDSLTPWALVWNCRYEGHPVLWHLGPWVLSRFTSLPDVMQAYHLLIATATAFLVARFAPFTWVERALLAIGYLFLYEYGVVCRDYGIGVLLIMTYCVLYPRRFQQLPAVSVVLFLLSQTSVHALLVAMAAGGSLFLEVLLRRRKPEGSARWPLALACLLLVMAGYAVSIWQLVPPPDSGFAVSWTTAWEPALARRVAALPAHAMWIWPRETLHFWGSSRVVAAPWFGRHLLLYSAVLPVAAVLFLMRRPAVLLTYIAGTLALLAFFYVKYFGSIRHHGFLYVLLVAAAWMALAEPAVPAPTGGGWGGCLPAACSARCWSPRSWCRRSAPGRRCARMPATPSRADAKRAASSGARGWWTCP
ncbi:hypothetical protein HQ590_13065 [bacterium]|nr:hypothetical protein [bacterium]